MIGLSKYSQAAKGSPNMASKGPAAQGEARAHTETYGKSNHPAIFKGSKAGLDTKKSTYIHMNGTGYDKASFTNKSNMASLHLKQPPRTTITAPIVDYRKLTFNGLRKDHDLSKLLK